MAAQLLRLKLALLGGAFRRSAMQVVGMAIAAAYGLVVMGVVVGGLIAARFAPSGDLGLLRDVVVVGGAVVTTGFLLLPLAFGVDDTLDPRKFALFGIETGRLARGLAVAAVVSIPALVLAVCLAASVVTWSRSAGGLLLAVVGAVLELATCVLGARLASGLAAYLLESRRSREIAGVASILLVVLISPVVLALSSVDWRRDGLDALHALADALRWTPLGAAVAAPADAAAGHPGLGVIELLIAAAFLALLWLGWRMLVARMLVTPGRASQAKRYQGLGWFGVLPHRPWAAVAARSLSYWKRDARYWVSLIMIPLVPVIMVLALLVVHAVPDHYIALLPLPVMSLFLGWTGHNDVAYDGTAIWMHVTAGVRGSADRIGRAIPVLVLGVILLAVGVPLTAHFFGDGRVASAMLGVCLALILTGIGLSSITSALVPYPVAKPGESPFQQPQSSNALSALVQAVSLFAIMLISSPAIVFAILGVFVDPVWLPASLVAGVVFGVAALVAGIGAGSAVFDRRGPQLLAAAIRAA